MDIIEFLLQRRSTPAPLLQDPAPDDTALRRMLQVAVTAPDHGGLRPWRFLMIREEARQRLGEIFAQGAQRRQPELSDAELEVIRKKPLRAPLIVTVIANVQTGNNIPQLEQLLSAGLAAYNIELAAGALGYGAIWITGAFASDPYVCKQLGLAPQEQIVAFIHLGSIGPLAKQAWEKALARPDAAAISQEWTGQ